MTHLHGDCLECSSRLSNCAELCAWPHAGFDRHVGFGLLRAPPQTWAQDRGQPCRGSVWANACDLAAINLAEGHGGYDWLCLRCAPPLIRKTPRPSTYLSTMRVDGSAEEGCSKSRMSAISGRSGDTCFKQCSTDFSRKP